MSSLWTHRELTVTTVVTAPGPMITAHSPLEEVTAQSRQGHSSVTARSQLSHGSVTAQSRHLQYDHGSVTARSQLNHGPGHGWLWPFWSPWAVTVANFFLMGTFSPGNWRPGDVSVIWTHDWRLILKLPVGNFGHWSLRYRMWNRWEWISMDLIDDKSTQVQVTAWCHQTTSRHLSHC